MRDAEGANRARFAVGSSISESLSSSEIVLFLFTGADKSFLPTSAIVAGALIFLMACFISLELESWFMAFFALFVKFPNKPYDFCVFAACGWRFTVIACLRRLFVLAARLR